ncbi:hypothetical protein BGM09_22455 [Streptomyces sp. CBMA29]|nr:hypothetical protein [Streptomyces sp. CBMA29]
MASLPRRRPLVGRAVSEDAVEVVSHDRSGRLGAALADEAALGGIGVRSRSRILADGPDTGGGPLPKRVHLVGSSYGGWLALNQAHRRSDRLASVALLDPGGLEKVGLRFFVWIVASLFATLAPKASRPRPAAWLELTFMDSTG